MRHFGTVLSVSTQSTQPIVPSPQDNWWVRSLPAMLPHLATLLPRLPALQTLILNGEPSSAFLQAIDPETLPSLRVLGAWPMGDGCIYRYGRPHTLLKLATILAELNRASAGECVLFPLDTADFNNPGIS